MSISTVVLRWALAATGRPVVVMLLLILGWHDGALALPQATEEQLEQLRILLEKGLQPPAERADTGLPERARLPIAGNSLNSSRAPGPTTQGQTDGLRLPQTVQIPWQSMPLPEHAIVETSGNNVTLIVRNASLSALLNALAEEMNLNVVSAGSVNGQISITLTDVPVEDALDAILSVNGYRWVRQKNIILVSSVSSETSLPPQVQGREVKVFRLSFASAVDVDKTVAGLLSPVGQSHVTEVDSEDKRKTREELVVEDLPEYLLRIEKYVAQADMPPAQVLIEAHVLQVNLRDENRHGVNLQNITSLTGGDISLSANGIANPNATPAFIINLDGRRLDAIVEMIKQTTDAKTLASPKVLAVNGQEARIQIGERLGYLTTTTTQTSTLQQVNFLDLGVVLTVTPAISTDGQILMTVRPEVSSGRINPTTGLPDSDTTEVQSTVLMPSGHAMVIGGLITEEDTDQQGKFPVLGDLPGVGKLFQRRNHLKDRTEIIIALVPRIVPYEEAAQYRHSAEVQRATTPVLYGPLRPVNRTLMEAQLPNANRACEPPGKGMHCFPTPPAAWSPVNPGIGQPLPYLPLLREVAPPPASIRPVPTIRQTSGETQARQPRRLYGLKPRGTTTKQDGWHARKPARRTH